MVVTRTGFTHTITETRVSSLTCFTLRSAGGGSSCHREGLLYEFSSFSSVSKERESPNIVTVLLKPVVDVFIRQIKRIHLCVRFLLRRRLLLLPFLFLFFFFLNLVVMPFLQPYDGNTWKSRFLFASVRAGEAMSDRELLCHVRNIIHSSAP